MVSQSRKGHLRIPALLAVAALLLTLETAGVKAAPTTGNGLPVAQQGVSTTDYIAATATTSPAADQVRSVAESTDRGAGGSRLPARTAVASGSAVETPWVALRAYQRSATIMAEAQRSCALPWSLLAAVGHVESHHGQYAGNRLGDDGVARPGVIGIPLDGTRNTSAIPDTDAGELDGDKRWDRAVGPMQFIPGTWRLVGVDGDGDGRRDIHDIDDASLAAGVYLCSSASSLKHRVGKEEALLAYNPSQAYVDRVLAVEAGYRGGDYAVAGAPEPQGIGDRLERGPGTAAGDARQSREARRAIRNLEKAPSPPVVAARRAGPAGLAERAGAGARRPSAAASDGQPSRRARSGADSVSDRTEPALPSGQGESPAPLPEREPDGDPVLGAPVEPGVVTGETPGTGGAEGTDDREGTDGQNAPEGTDDGHETPGTDAAEGTDDGHDTEATYAAEGIDGAAGEPVTGVLVRCGRDLCVDDLVLTIRTVPEDAVSQLARLLGSEVTAFGQHDGATLLVDDLDAISPSIP